MKRPEPPKLPKGYKENKGCHDCCYKSGRKLRRGHITFCTFAAGRIEIAEDDYFTSNFDPNKHPYVTKWGICPNWRSYRKPPKVEGEGV